MQIIKPKAILQKALPLFLSLAMLAGLLPVSPLVTTMIKRCRGQGCRSGPRGGAAVAGPRGAAAVGPRGNAVAATPRSYVHTGAASVTAGPRRAYAEGPGSDRLMWAPGGQPSGALGGGAVSGPGQWAPGPWWWPGPPTMWPAGFIIARSIRVARWSTRRYRIPSDNSESAWTENDLGGVAGALV